MTLCYIRTFFESAALDMTVLSIAIENCSDEFADDTDYSPFSYCKALMDIVATWLCW